MVEVVVTFLGVLQRKLNARTISINTDAENGGGSLRTLLTKILEKLAHEQERNNFKTWVFDPAKPNHLNPEMAYILGGRHLKPSTESLDVKITENQELVIFPADAGG